MAGDWIKFEKTTIDKPEVFQIASMLEIDPDAVVGKLIRVWNWFDDQSRDGHADVTVMSLLDRVTGVTGFVNAMQCVGWMVIEGDSMLIPNFARHNGGTAKNRALAKNRKEKQRSNVTDLSRSQRDISVTKTRPEKRREEKNKKEPQVATPLPFNSDAFATAWNNWLTHKKEIKQKMPPTTIKAQLTKCEKWGEEKSIMAIENAIAGKWQGLFEPKETETNGHRPLFDTPTYVKNGTSRNRPLWD